MPNVNLVACVQTPNMGIGLNNDLVWRFTEDLKRFKELTHNHPVIMGRKTYESIGRPLPQRTNIVLSGDINYVNNDVFVARNISEAMACAIESLGGKEVFVIGGSKVYSDFMPFANKLYLTLVEGDRECDTYFPNYDDLRWEVIFEKEDYCKRNDKNFKYVTLQRR